MNYKFSSWKSFVCLLMVLLVAKFGISYLYNQDMSLDKIKYQFYTASLEEINTQDLKAILEEKANSIYLIFVGRDTCPTCIDTIGNVSQIFSKCDDNLEGEYTVFKCYYNTKKYNEKAAVELRNDLGIKYIPAILVVKNGDMFKFDEENLVVSDYLDIFQNDILKRLNK